jgi:hypothetical protein
LGKENLEVRRRMVLSQRAEERNVFEGRGGETRGLAVEVLNDNHEMAAAYG